MLDSASDILALLSEDSPNQRGLELDPGDSTGALAPRVLGFRCIEAHCPGSLSGGALSEDLAQKSWRPGLLAFSKPFRANHRSSSSFGLGPSIDFGDRVPARVSSTA